MALIYTPALLYLGLALLCLTVVKAVVGILFFKHWTALIWFLAETLVLTALVAAHVFLNVEGGGRLICALGTVVFGLIFYYSLRTYRRAKT